MNFFGELSVLLNQNLSRFLNDKLIYYLKEMF